MQNNLDKPVRHVIQTILSQMVDVNNHVRAQQENKELSEGDKNASINFPAKKNPTMIKPETKVA